MYEKISTPPPHSTKKEKKKNRHQIKGSFGESQYGEIKQIKKVYV